MKIYILLAIVVAKSRGFSLPENDDNDFFEIEVVGDSEARLLNTSFLNGIFNNSLLTIGAFVIVGIILFELALYALDVYYNQTYGSSGQLFSKIDEQAYNEYYKPSDNNYYGDFPPYYDAFSGTFRSFGTGWKNLDKILEWINIAQNSYEVFNEVKNDSDCQAKAVCEIYRNSKELGEISARARHSLDYMDTVKYFSMPDDIQTFWMILWKQGKMLMAAMTVMHNIHSVQRPY